MGIAAARLASCCTELIVPYAVNKPSAGAVYWGESKLVGTASDVCAKDDFHLDHNFARAAVAFSLRFDLSSCKVASCAVVVAEPARNVNAGFEPGAVDAATPPMTLPRVDVALQRYSLPFTTACWALTHAASASAQTIHRRLPLHRPG